MTDLILAPNLTTLNVSAELWRLLSTGPMENVETIGRSPVLKAEAASLRASLQGLADRSGPAYVQKCLAPLVLVYGLGDQASAPQFWKAYNDVLSKYPRIALDRAISEWYAVGKFFPKPAEIRELAEPHAEAICKAAARVGQAAKYEAPVNKRDNRTPAEIAAVGKMLGDFMAVMETKKVPEAPRKPVRGPVDDRGVTSAGRAIIERMRSQG